jgi:oligopeptide transport system ATP-binding protein
MTSLNPVFRTGWQVGEPLRLHRGYSKLKAMREVIKAFGRVGIPDAERRIKDFPHEFSGGMRQRAMIAMSVTTTPALLIADEPTTALDVTIQAQILELLRQINTDYNMATILITHNLGVVAGMCKRILVMYAGRIVESGLTAEVFANPKHPYTLGLLQSMPRLDARERLPLMPIEGQPPDPLSLPSGCAFHPRCRFRVDRCSSDVPELEQVGGRSQQAACWVSQGGVDLK